MTTPGLLVDYGGVLTASLGQSFEAVEDELDLERGAVTDVLRDAYADDDGGIVGRVERGELDRSAVIDLVADRLGELGAERDGEDVLGRLFSGLRPDGKFWDVVAQARSEGVRTGLLSNSWGIDGYPRDRLREHFDVLLISGEVGLRKPDPAIFHLACEKLGVPPSRTAFVDDFRPNVEAAERLGLHGVLYRHRDLEEIVDDLMGFLDVELFQPT